MARSTHSIVLTLVLYFLLLFSHIFTSKAFKDFRRLNETSVTFNKMKLINARLKKINKPFLKSIKSPDGDIIDCVLFNLQPAFDLAEITEKMSLDPPELPKGHDSTKMETEIKQIWSSSGESCPNGTIPIKRATPSDVLRSMSIPKFRKNLVASKDITGLLTGHEHAIGYAIGGEYYGAKAVLNVWKPDVFNIDFSISQIWVTTGVPTTQSVEAGWQAYPMKNKDGNPRVFNYWTPNGYRSGCYNLECPGFVQINTKIALGAAIYPISTYTGDQYDIAFLIWKDPKSCNWWFKIGSEVMGYWPHTLFTDLCDHATILEYGGEVFSPNVGKHTSTQMGSGHFPNEGFKKAAYVRNLEFVDKDNLLNPVSNVYTFATKPNCYDVINGSSDAMGNYIFFGGPGYNPNCP